VREWVLSLIGEKTGAPVELVVAVSEAGGLGVLGAAGYTVEEMFNRAQKEEFMGPFSGQVSGLIKEIKPAAVILEEMVAETVDILSRRLPETVVAKA